MSARAAAMLAAAACIGLALAQDAAPGWSGFHTWQYAAALAIAMIAIVGYVLEARQGRDGEAGRRWIVAMIGTLVLGMAALSSGLLGPDTQIVTQAPGTVAPLPAIGAAAFFPLAGPAEIARGDARLTLRRRDGTSSEVVFGRSRFVGANALRLVPHVAAFVEAKDLRGNHLTVTQPTNPSFLSPVLLFGQNVPIAGKDVPSDAFAAPALHRQIKAFYFEKGVPGAQHAANLGTGPAMLFAIDDDDGRLIPGAIGFARSGAAVRLGGLELRASLGTYPALEISAIPYPLAMWLGVALTLAGVGYARLPWPKILPGARAREGAV